MAVADPDMQTPGDAASKDDLSYIYPIGYSNSSDCGYCKRGQSASRFSYYAATKTLSPCLYQKLVDRCFRRSGTLLYRPNQKMSCCPHYTLRLDSSNFKPKRDQRQAVNRFTRFVLGDAYIRNAARLCPLSREEARKRNNEFDLIERIHEPEMDYLLHPVSAWPEDEITGSRMEFEPAHQFVVTLEPDDYTEEKYALFENYQRQVHKEGPERISRKGFKRFLCESPLRRGEFAGSDGEQRQLGSFHHCYRLDGRLVAVGVLDLLPDCVSAVYFMYHETFQSWQPGKIGASREIALAKEKGYRWWYSGYYIHKCAKMKYKIDFQPQYILDPETLEWDPLDKVALALLDKQNYVSLSRERESQARPKNTADDTLEASMENTAAGAVGTGVQSGAVDSGVNMLGEEEEWFLLRSRMPGIPSLEEMQVVDMDNFIFRTDRAYNNDAETIRVTTHKLSELVSWADEEMDQFGTLKSRVAELAAAVGPDLMREICIDLCRRGSG